MLIACLGNAVIPSHAIGQSLNQRVLVVYNTNFADSLTVANHYMTQRGIPAANLCAISPPSSTEITMTDYVNTVRTPIRTCLTNAGRTNILYIVFSYLTPYRVSVPNPYFVYSVDSFVSDIWDQYTTQLFNPVPTAPHRYYAASQSQGNAFLPFVSLATYRTQPKATLLYSVWRLDAATLALAEGLVDKAMQAESAGGPAGQGCFDSRSGDPNLLADAGYQSGDWTIHAAAQLMSQAGIGVTEDTNFEEFGTAPAPLTCPNAAFYSGWYSFNNYNDAFTWNPGAIGFHLDSASAIDPRGGSSWSPNAVIHGITVTSGSVTEPFLEGLPRPGGVYRNLLEGANVGDAFLRNTQWIKWMIMNIGDPLYRPFANGRAPFNQGLGVNSLALNSQQVVGGAAITGNSTGTITLSAPAPLGGTSFSLTSGSLATASVPASVTVASGKTQATFPVTTTAVTTPAFIRITASGPVTLNNTLQVYPLLGGISPSQSIVSAGQTITGTVSLNDRSPIGGAVVNLSSSNTSVATVPATVTVPAGLSSATFNIQTSAATASTDTTLSATYAGYTVTATLTAVPAISSMDIYPSSTLPAGSFATFEIYLAVPAPPGGALVTITNGNPAVTTLPPSITIGAGAHYGNTNLTVMSSASSGAMDQITVMYGGDAKQITLTVQ